MSDPLSWTVVYPLGLAAAALVSGDKTSAIAATKSILERASEPLSQSPYLREFYQTEAHLINRRQDLDERLVPLWVADIAIRKPDLTPPGLMQYSLNVFLSTLEQEDDA